MDFQQGIEMNAEIKEQTDELAADIRHSLDWALKNHGEAARDDMRKALFAELFPMETHADQHEFMASLLSMRDTWPSPDRVREAVASYLQ